MGKKVTMADIAGRLGVSVNAVSLALNDRNGVGEKTRKLIVDTAEEMGYLKQSGKYTPAYPNKNLCILLETRFFNDMQFYGRVLLGLDRAARDAGYDLFINSFEGKEEVPACVANRKVAGIIVVGLISDNFLNKLKAYELPVLLLDYTSSLESVDSVMTNNKMGTFRMTKYLIDKGFRKIGFFGGLTYSPSIRERFFGYVEALQQSMQFQDFAGLMDYVMEYSACDFVEEAVIAKDLTKIGSLFDGLRHRPQVLICSNDKVAILLSKVLFQRGIRIPEDISIAGFDDIELGKMASPRLTTVHVYKEQMGKIAVERLLKRMEQPDAKAEKIVMDVKIVERDSVGIPVEGN